MAQAVTSYPDRPGQRREDNLVDSLNQLGLQATVVRVHDLRGVNDEMFGKRLDALLTATGHLLTANLPKPGDQIAKELEDLKKAAARLRIPTIDPTLDEPTETLEKLRAALGLLVNAIYAAHLAASEARSEAAESPPEIVPVHQGHVDAMLARLDRVEIELKKVASERDTAPAFVQQSGLINFYVDKMRVKIDLARLHLTIDGVTYDLGALAEVVEAMGDLTKRFRATVNAWSGRVTAALAANAATAADAVIKVVRGARTLVKFVSWTAKRAEHNGTVSGTRGQSPDTSWADASGNDQYGPWASFTVSAEDGREATQRLRWIPPGEFMIGSPDEEEGRYDDEGPQRLITIRRGFWMFDTPCTEALWEVVMEPLGSARGLRFPVVGVSWNDTQNFIARLNEKRPGLGIDLPGEAQWEYACRAGTVGANYAVPPQALGDIAWYHENSGGERHPVGRKAPNAWGLYDMLGNVWEWCADEYGDLTALPGDGSARAGGGSTAVTGRNSAAGRVVRGGAWGDGAGSVRAAYRSELAPVLRVYGLGFRCARGHFQ